MTRSKSYLGNKNACKEKRKGDLSKAMQVFIEIMGYEPRYESTAENWHKDYIKQKKGEKFSSLNIKSEFSLR